MIRSKIIRRVRLNKLFFRILLYFVSLLLPIIIIGVIFYAHINDRIKNESLDKLQLNLQSAAATIDIYMRTAQETSLNIFHEPDLYLLPYQEYNAYDRIQMADVSRKLSRISSNLGALTDNLFFYVDDSIVYTGEGIDGFRDYFDRLYTFEAYDYTYWQSKLQTARPFEFLHVSDVKRRNGLVKPVVPVVMSDTLNGHKAVMVTTISVDMLRQTIQSYAQAGSNWFVVTDHTHQIILDSYAGELKESTLHQLSEAFQSGRAVHDKLELEGGRAVAAYVKSENYGWNYYSIMPVSDLKQQTSYFFTLIVTICLTLVVIGIVFSFIFAFNLYNPIKRLRDVLLEKSELFGQQEQFSGKDDEFQWIGKGIRRLIEHNYSFKSDMLTISAELNDRLIVSFLHGHTSLKDESELRERLSGQLHFDHPAYLCSHVKFGFKPTFFKDIQDTDRLIILDKIKNIVHGILLTHMNTYVLEDEQQLFICLFNLREDEGPEQVKLALRHLIDTFNHDLQYCYIHIGIGRLYHDLNGLKQSHTDAMLALETAESDLDFQMIDAAALPSVALQYVYSIMDESIILNCLKTQSMTSLTHKIDEILEKNGKVGSHRISSLLTDMYRTGCRLLAEHGEDAQQFVEPEEHAVLRAASEAFPDVDEKKRLLIGFFDRVMRWIGDRKTDASGSVIPAIIQYVENNYHQDLYLEKIADELGVSAKYVSRAFSEKIGVTLSHYISSYRMSKAKELLLETDMKISDISERVGIYSRSTFIRLFKRHVGITPLEYRKIRSEVQS